MLMQTFPDGEGTRRHTLGPHGKQKVFTCRHSTQPAIPTTFEIMENNDVFTVFSPSSLP